MKSRGFSEEAAVFLVRPMGHGYFWGKHYAIAERAGDFAGFDWSGTINFIILPSYELNFHEQIYLGTHFVLKCSELLF
jgi:hypothetical protein